MNKYKIIFENNNFLVINKPAGMLVHGASHIKEKSLVDQLLKQYPDIAKVGEDPTRPGIMHRLDKLASGLMVIARDQENFDYFKNQFKKRKVKKTYTALVYGKIEADLGEINFSIARKKSGQKMVALPAKVKGKENNRGRFAISEFEVIKRYINYTLVKVKIKTGRTHQIRVHFAAYGNPIVGDDLYGTKKNKLKNKKLDLERIFLVATELYFVDLNAKEYDFKIGLPIELKKLLKRIK